MNSVLICDDHPLMREALALAIGERWPRARQLLAGSYPAAWRLAREGPDLMLVDLAMPGADPATGLSRLKAEAPRAHLIVVTGSQDEVQIDSLAAIGIDGLVEKTEDIRAVFTAIETVLAGGSYGHPRAAARIRPRNSDALTKRQLEVLRLMAKGLPNKAIARELCISPETVKVHVAQIIAVAGALNRTDAALWAVKHGLAS